MSSLWNARSRHRAPAARLPAELADIVGELFDLLARTRRATDAMERCAAEAPDLAELFFRGVRGRLLDELGGVLARGSRTRARSPRRSRPICAPRFILETTTWWARHRHRDPEPPTVDEAGARATAVSLIVAALCGPAPPA